MRDELFSFFISQFGEATAGVSALASLPSWPTSARLMWLAGLLAEYESPNRFASRKKFLAEFRDRVAEWFDLDIQASHHAYGHDYLCTFDFASNTGTAGVMHADRVAGNTATFGIKIVSPKTLLTLLP